MAVVYRVDKFAVPEPVREEFWRQVRRTHAILRTQPGFLDDALLEQHSGPGRFNAVTIVRWASADDLPAARAAVHAAHRAEGFEPAVFFEHAGIEADLANYVDAPAA
ncbi:antibiotic biosynthesis monooxygenase family protein [Micromonospora sp. DT233]|uniref:antibiotic biosynthesis monooxygenase family protein n=1 Tax=Micromonospora sp. DT233 TaxID=3393432 RepID=UPI003CF28D51